MTVVVWVGKGQQSSRGKARQTPNAVEAWALDCRWGMGAGHGGTGTRDEDAYGPATCLTQGRGQGAGRV